MRVHLRGGRVLLEVWEHSTADGTVTLDPPAVHVQVEADLDADAARHLAAELVNAADLLGRLTGR